MKSLVSIVAIMPCASLLPAQQLPVTTYLQFLETKTADVHFEEKVVALSPMELKHAARMIYEATESDPIAVIKYIGKSHRAFDSAYATNKSTKRFGRKIGAVEQRYLDRIDTVFSKRVYALVRLPYVMSVVIDSEKHVRYTSPGEPGTTPRTNAVATVLEVFKGAKRFAAGETMEFYWMDGWIMTSTYFRLGDTCLVFLDPRVRPDGVESLAIVAFLDQSYGYYVIRNNILHDQYNTFGYGTMVPWKDFRDSLLSQIKSIKSW